MTYQDSTKNHDYDAVIIGGGCAGLSLARRAHQLPYKTLAVIEPKDKKQDHAWGIFPNSETDDALAMARKTWAHWQIITPKGAVTQTSHDRPYACLESKAWLSHCREQVRAHGVDLITGQVTDIELNTHANSITTDHGQITTGQIFDSRPNPIPKGMMIQHFIGHEIQVSRPVFDPETAILMDFRCDQSRGIHFIYILPFSATQALVESTLFSPQIEDNAFYETAISAYLEEYYGITEKITLRREQGAIPMGFMPEDHSTGLPIGGRGGAIRPSSGYAFGFIQKQIAHVMSHLKSGEMPQQMTPHQTIDLWMDRIFLKVIRNQPQLAPRLFHAMAKALNGNEMARFMTGDADYLLRLKVIMAMPKYPFLKALIKGGG